MIEDPFAHKILESSKGVSCHMCGADATHKIGEEGADPRRHNWTNYLCCACFGKVLGPAVVEWCQGKFPSNPIVIPNCGEWEAMATSYVIDPERDIHIIKEAKSFPGWSVVRGVGWIYPSLLSKADRMFIILSGNCTAEVIKDTRFATKNEAYAFYQECKAQIKE